MPSPRYTTDSLARLATSCVARDASDLFRSATRRDRDTPGRSDLAGSAQALVFDARAVLDFAVITERLRGVSWEALAEHVPAPAVHSRLADTSPRQRFRVGSVRESDLVLAYGEAVAKFGDLVESPPALRTGEKDELPGDLAAPHLAVTSLQRWLSSRQPVKGSVLPLGLPAAGAVALLKVSVSARNLSDGYRQLVPTIDDGRSAEGDLVARAAGLYGGAMEHRSICGIADRFLNRQGAERDSYSVEFTAGLQPETVIEIAKELDRWAAGEQAVRRTAGAPGGRTGLVSGGLTTVDDRGLTIAF